MPELRQRLQATLGSAYTLERELGGGGMSRVFVADETALARKVVVKVLSPELAAGVSVERFNREIQVAARLQHPHIVPVLSAGDAGGLPFYTMPFVEGASLRARLGQGPLAITEAVGVLRDVARALAFAHARGVVHRDIKPDNVLLSEGSATVTDFGIAKAISAARTGDGAPTLTMAGTSIGTPAYMAPEQAAGDPNIDHRSDLYAFGCMAYEVLTGRPPFTGSSPAKLLGAHLGEKPADIRTLRADTPEPLAALVMQCLEKDPEARPQQGSDLVRVLDTVTSSGAATAAPSILAGRINVGKALGLWALATALVALTAWAATVVVGLPDWVLPGSLGVMLAGLPIIAFTAWVQRVAHRAYTATPTFTPGGTSTTAHGTLNTIALKASPHVSWRRTWMGGAWAVGAFAVLVIGFMVLRALGIGPVGSLLAAGKLDAGDQIIITDFASPAADSTLGVTVTEALRADLAESSILRVLPRLTVVEVLRLMERPVNSRVDFDLARMIATREGLKAVLDGDIVELGGRYKLTTRLISADGQQLATFSEDASSENDLIPAIGRLGKQIRAKSGESLKRVRESGALDRVTTGSLEALRKYAAANLAFDQTGDYARTLPLLQEAVEIDSTFAMAWRRLASYYSNIGRADASRQAIIQAHRYADKLGDVERQLMLASYYTHGPELDDERALAAYEAVIARDSTNLVALNNAAVLSMRRRDFERSLGLLLTLTAQRGATPLVFGNAIRGALTLGRWELVDSLHRAAAQRFPGNPNGLRVPMEMAAIRGEFDRAEQLAREIEPAMARSQSTMFAMRAWEANLAFTRGHVREGLRLRADQRERMMRVSPALSRLMQSLDSVPVTAIVLEDPAAARAIMARALRRAPIDSIPYLDRDYGLFLRMAADAGDTARAREWHAADRESWEQRGRRLDRDAALALADARLARAFGRYEEALEKLRLADRLRHERTDILTAERFHAFDRLQQADSAIAAGEAYVAGTYWNRLTTDAYFLAGIRQRLGELYEARGDTAKALAHYQAFVDLWKDADPELQPRVRDVRARVERLQRTRG
ncbi:MAG TPA: protein kinase [Gemmatimonadaceae bacterium]